MPGTRKLGRPTAHRKAMLRGLVTLLLENGQVETTLTRAKELRAVADKMITLGKANTLASRRAALAYTKTQVVHEHANSLRFGLARNRGLADVSINNGMLLCLVLCIAAYVLIYATKKERKWYQISYILIFLDAFLTLSRAIWLELLITQILIFIVLAPKSKLKIIGKIIAIGVIGALLLVCISPELLEKISFVFYNTTCSARAWRNWQTR